MNKRLLAAFLTFAAMPLFTQTTKNTELLSYLQTIKAEIETPLAQLSEVSKEAEQTYGESFTTLKNATHELYALVAEAIAPDIDKIFNELCTQMIPLKEIVNFNSSIDDTFEHLFKNDFINTHTKEIEAILNKYNNNDPQAQEKSTRTMEKRIIDYFFKSPDNTIVLMMVTAQEISKTLLEKIDEKIAELEAQL